MTFTIDAIKEYERLFQMMGSSKSKTHHIKQLRSLMQLCGASPTNYQIARYVKIIGKDTFSFGDFLDIMSRQMETFEENNVDKLLFEFFAHHDPRLNTPKEGFVSVKELRELLCNNGRDRDGSNQVNVKDFDTFLEKNGIGTSVQLISVVKFIQLFGNKATGNTK